MISNFLERFRSSESLIREIDQLRSDLLKKESHLSAALATVSQLRTLNEDIGSQLSEKQKQRLMSDSEFTKLTTITQEVNRLTEEQNELAFWLRNNRGAEISRGDHTGLSFPQVLILYLSRGKRLEEEGVRIPVTVTSSGPGSKEAVQ